MNSLELIRFKPSLSWCVSLFGTFMSAFVLFQFSSWGIYASFTLNTCANKDIHLHQFETRVFDFWPPLLLLHFTFVLVQFIKTLIVGLLWIVNLLFFYVNDLKILFACCCIPRP